MLLAGCSDVCAGMQAGCAGDPEEGCLRLLVAQKLDELVDEV